MVGRCEGWCGRCYENVRGRSNYKGHKGFRQPPKPPFQGIEMTIRRRDSAVTAAGGPKAVPISAWQKGYPLLWEFLSQTKYEDGSERRLPTITLFLGTEGLQACLNDRDQGLAAFVTATTLEGLWGALEEGLKKDSLDWRVSQNPNFKKGKK